MAPRRNTTTTSITDAAIKALIAQRVANALAEYEANRGSGFVGLTQWFEKMESVFHISNCTTISHEAAYGMTWKTLKKMMTDKMFLEESDEVEKYVDGLPDMIQGSVVASKPKTMQDAIEFASELMDQKIRFFADRQAENKRKLDDNSRNN
ncbi:hypothetical protein Tco_1296354 [Tanacetum coccineum]